ncbi:MAG TPA: GNAT family N-acetyltransferase [Trebonia sp.]|nr:GNAT family N-acetyltransferase [Trebonia sp.]
MTSQAVIFRDARRTDVPQIVALLADDVLGASREAGAGPDGELAGAYLAAFERVEASPDNRIIVAEAGGQVVGTLQLTIIPGLSRQGVTRAQVESVRVAGTQRGQGLGHELIGWAVAEARRAGCGLVQLTSDKQRPGAIRFYESLGFTATHEGLKLPLERSR